MSKRGKKSILFVLEIIVLLLFIGGLFVYGQITSRLDKIEQPVLHEEKIVVNPAVKQSGLTGYTTYALFGIDRRTKNKNYTGENSDTIIIASVNNDTKDVKLVSIYRDTLLNIGDDTYSKANAAYAYGGPEQAISMLNTNLDLDIKDYATIDFSALTAAADALGGLDIPLSYAEMVHMNNYCIEVSEETGKSYTPVPLPEPAPEDLEAVVDTFHLNGVQVTSYCRIRYTASMDMGRTERQRRVLQMLTDKAKKAGLTSLFDLMDEIFPMVTTSLSKNEILQLIPTVIGYSLNETTGFPASYKFADINQQSVILPTDLITNVKELHAFLYGANTPYTPSAEVTAYSTRIDEIAAQGGAGASITEIPEEPADYEAQTWTEDSSSGYDDYSNDYSSDYDNGYSSDDNTDYTTDYNTDDSNDYSNDDNSGYDDFSDDYTDGGSNDYTGDTGGGDGGDTGDGGYTGEEASFEDGGETGYTE